MELNSVTFPPAPTGTITVLAVESPARSMFTFDDAPSAVAPPVGIACTQPGACDLVAVSVITTAPASAGIVPATFNTTLPPAATGPAAPTPDACIEHAHRIVRHEPSGPSRGSWNEIAEHVDHELCRPEREDREPTGGIQTDEGEVGDRGVAVVDVDVGRGTRDTGARGECLQVSACRPLSGRDVDHHTGRTRRDPGLPDRGDHRVGPRADRSTGSAQTDTGVDDSCRSHRDEL